MKEVTFSVTMTEAEADAKSPANMLHQMARLADDLESQGAEIIGVSLNVVGSHLHLSAHDLPASIAERGANRECYGEFDKISYIDASGVRVCWLVDKETRHD